MDASPNRPRRISVKKSNKLDLLKKIREAKQKGERYVVETEEKPIYETVDESTYSKIVQQRIEDDWIVDDEGIGYADDGREIFDDNDGDAEEDSKPSSKRSRKENMKKRFNPDIRPSASGGKSKDIRHMFATGVSHKPKSKTGPTGESCTVDAALDDLLAELESPGPSKSRKSVQKTKPEKLTTNRYKIPKEPERKRKHATPTASIHISQRTKPSEVVVEVVKKPIRPNRSNAFAIKPMKQGPHPVGEMEVKQEPMETVVDIGIFDDDVNFGEEENANTESVIEEEKKEVTAPWLKEEEEELEEQGETVTISSFEPAADDADRLRFFWLDAYEDVKHQPGVIFLFGKVATKEDNSGFQSCCVRVKDLDRRLFFLPQPDTDCTVKDVYAEIRELSGQWKIGKFKCKPTTKKYAFDLPDVPSESEYLEVRYSANFPALPSDLTGKTFSKVFGCSTTFLENLILDHHLRGPCWLEFEGAVQLTPQISWCKIDYDMSMQHPNKMVNLHDALMARSETAADFKILPPPPLRLVAIDIKSVLRRETNSSEIISIGLLVDSNFYLDRPTGIKNFQSHYLVLAPPKDAVLPYDLGQKLPTWGAQYQPPKASKAESCSSLSTNDPTGGLPSGVDVEPNERALLGRLLTRFHRLDPDIIVGHDLWGHQLDLLVHRLNSHKVAHWHRIGRLRRSAGFILNFNRSWFMRNVLPGRLVCDTRISARELVRSRTYNLSELAHQELGSSGDKMGSRRQIPLAVRRQFSTTKTATPTNEEDEDAAALLSGIDLEVDSADLRCFFTSSILLKDLIDFCLSDALLILRLTHQLQALPLANQITSICGNVLSRTLCGGRSERNEALLLHAFTEHGYLCPDPLGFVSGQGRKGGAAAANATIMAGGDDGDEIAAQSGRRKPTYAGGLVLEPKKGFYDTYILLLDFNSLYPSIIQEFNLCFTTMERSFFAVQDAEDSDKDNEDMYISELISSVTQSTGSATSGGEGSTTRLPTNQSPGILPTELRRLVESRREVKKLISAGGDAARMAQWNIRQAALKITANSVYGCLGFYASRFCARRLAALVTGLGRALLINTKELVENMQLEVVYGDTDSIMVNTNSRDLVKALAIGEKVKQEVNKRYRLVELDTDGVFTSMLLLAKKKYAALSIVNPLQLADKLRSNPDLQVPTKAEMKGLDIVRRDWCRLAAHVGRFCVNTLLAGQTTSEQVLERIHEHLRIVATQVRQGELPKTDFVVTKMLTKNPEDYPDAKSQPHVQVALRYNVNHAASDLSGRRFRAGDTVEYIICEDGTRRSAVQRAYSPAELVNPNDSLSLVVKSEENEDGKTIAPEALRIDVHYYLANQVHPVVSRLVAPIEGTSPAHIADCLGLDPASYHRNTASADYDNDHGADDDAGGSLFSGSSLLTVADSLKLACPNRKETGCKGVASINQSPFTQSGLATWMCPECSLPLLRSENEARSAVNQLVLQCRTRIADYERGWLVCEDPACGLWTRNLAAPPSGSGSDGGGGSWSGPGLKPVCPACSGQSLLRPAQVSEAQLYRQLVLFKHMFNPNGAQDRSKRGAFAGPLSNLPIPVKQILKTGHRYMSTMLSQSAFAMVDLSNIFAGLKTTTKSSTRSTPFIHVH